MNLEIRRYDEKAKAALSEARALLAKAEQEGRELTTEEDARFNALHEDAERFVKMRERLKEQEAAEARDLEDRERRRMEAERQRQRDGQPNAEQRKAQYREAFLSWIRGGGSSLSGEQRAILQRGFRAVAADGEESRVLTTAQSGSYGGYAIPEDFMNTVERVMKQYAAVLRAPIGVFSTGGGGPLQWPTSDDTTQTGELLAETSAAATQDVTLSRVTFASYTYSSKIVLVQNQLLQDEEVNLESFLAEALGERLGRITGAHFTTGTGSGQPQGIVTGATVASPALSWSLAGGAPEYPDLVDLVHAVDPAYRAVDSYHLMFPDAGLKTIRKLVDATSGQPIWQPGGVAFAAAPTILGLGYTVNNDMPALSNGNKSYLVGDMSKFKVRRVGRPIMLRLVERYAEYLQTAFLMYLRADSHVINTPAIKYATVVT